MHSSILRGHDFTLYQGGQPRSHAAYFAGFSPLERLGLVAPTNVEGAGAATLILAYVTAFYDCYRQHQETFYAYPDYYSFQSRQPLADHKMLDIWPAHKEILVPDDAAARLTAIVDRGITVLLVPERPPCSNEFAAELRESARRTIKRCYLYSGAGQVEKADLTFGSANPDVVTWAESIFATPDLPNSGPAQQIWRQGSLTKSGITQSFRTISLEEALSRL
ncbi:MAG: hypothetical protein KDE59_24680 [Anaerolineales bacterium]|nr:hypothetical protein [Anaerolineales bacterium]